MYKKQDSNTWAINTAQVTFSSKVFQRSFREKPAALTNQNAKVNKNFFDYYFFLSILYDQSNSIDSSVNTDVFLQHMQ